jgi:hypothetical protein
MLKSVTATSSSDTADTTAFMDAYKTSVLGLPSATLSAEGMFAFDTTANQAHIDNVLQNLMAQEAAEPVTYAVDGGVTAGKLVRGGPCYESSVQVSGSVSDLVGITAEFQVTDGFFNGLSLRDPDTPLALTGAASPGTGVDYTAFATDLTPAVQMQNGGIAVLHVMNNTVNASTTLKIQHSTLIGGTYIDIATFTIPATTVDGYFAVVAPTNIDKFIRYNITATGTGNLSFLAYFAPRAATSDVA